MGVNGLRGFWLIFLFTLFMSWAVAQARRSRGRRVGDSYLFPPIYAIPLILSAEICLGSTLVYLSRGDREASVILGLLLVVGPICAWPKGIFFSDSMVRQHTWYGGWKAIPWADVVAVEEDRNGSVTICSDSAKIQFSQFHVDRDFFIKEVRRHCPRVTAHLI
jgi:hypothetical protein